MITSLPMPTPRHKTFWRITVTFPPSLLSWEDIVMRDVCKECYDGGTPRGIDKHNSVHLATTCPWPVPEKSSPRVSISVRSWHPASSSRSPLVPSADFLAKTFPFPCPRTLKFEDRPSIAVDVRLSATRAWSPPQLAPSMTSTTGQQVLRAAFVPLFPARLA